MSSDCVSIKYEGCYPSCHLCWIGYIFAHNKVFCDNCGISRPPPLGEEVHRNRITGKPSYCSAGHELVFNKDRTRFVCQK